MEAAALREGKWDTLDRANLAEEIESLGRSERYAIESHLQNLAWACLRCNRYKGPNVCSFDPETGRLVPLFNPRTQDWMIHFAWEGAIIQPLTPEGRVTVTILCLNDADCIAECQRLLAAGLYG